MNSAELEEQERRLVFTRFTNDDAWDLGVRLVEMARERDLAVTVDIRRGDHRLFHHARPGTTADNDDWIERKIRVVRRFEAASFRVGQRYRDQGTTFEVKSGLDPARYAAHGGCFPIRIADAGLIGTVTVSGLPQAEDHALVVEALELHLRPSG
ncbi:heme-degrading domain-containing protein [Actinocorallia longicatena]|uniref:UPF0303 protein GCM10010468_77440 n=1 Tax=Actinocorallia longicatena TaxID=111803 RepID=A0ABP6QLQ3_9ACTN